MPWRGEAGYPHPGWWEGGEGKGREGYPCPDWGKGREGKRYPPGQGTPPSLPPLTGKQTENITHTPPPPRRTLYASGSKLYQHLLSGAKFKVCCWDMMTRILSFRYNDLGSEPISTKYLCSEIYVRKARYVNTARDLPCKEILIVVPVCSGQLLWRIVTKRVQPLYSELCYIR